jgi:hypothetical protein
MKTTILEDGDYNRISISDTWNNGDFTLRFAVKTTYMEEYLTESELEDTDKYQIEILAVSPQAAKKSMKKAYDSMGIDADDLAIYKKNRLFPYQALLEYGIYATLWTKSGNDQDDLEAEATKQLDIIHMLFGFYMDRPENQIGSDGWDFIKGDILAGLNRQ